MRIVILVLAFFILFGFPAPAHAYIGPGLSVGAIGIIVGFITSILLSLFAILWYPVKRLWGWLMKTGKKNTSTDSDPHL